MEIKKCRICGEQNLAPVLSLGTMDFTGIFPRDKNEQVHEGELALVLCRDCSLLQLDRSFPGELLYGDSYGYRSGLNRSMVQHLSTLVSRVQASQQLAEGDVVLDIGSNDGTTLSLYSTSGLKKIGIDPSAGKFSHYYEPGTAIVSDFFSKKAYFSAMETKASAVTSIAMLYDLEDPVQFARDVHDVLADDGIWLFEQSYMPWMVETGAYDTICHEHLEYYSLKSIRQILSRAGFVVVDADFTLANGGSVVVLARKAEFFSDVTTELDEKEKNLDLTNPSYFESFASGVKKHGEDFGNLVRSWVSDGKKVIALGASTKGSVVLQNAKLDTAELSCVGDVNDFKFGRLMSGTSVPIISESAALETKPDYAIILPWHFRSTFDEKLREFKSNGGHVVYPLPSIEVQ